ncbi:MAG: non-canonical purine NTP pyrophosphatase [Ferroplasma sp.]
MIKFVTSNQHKFEEVKTLAEEENIKILWVKMEYPEIQADTNSIISRDSCEKLSSNMEAPFFIDDTGLYIDDLNGFPGPYASYIQNTLGNLNIIRLAAGSRAHFETVISLYYNKEIFQFSGILNGTISDHIGEGREFGYDPIFIPDGYSNSLAEISVEEKNLISHRGKALKKLFAFILLKNIK